MTTFVDSSIWFAAAAKQDRSNELAKSILMSARSPIITDHVLSETWLLLKTSFGDKVADLFWDTLRQSGIRPEPTKDSDLEYAWQIGRRFPDFSFVDRISLAFMELRGITEVATLGDNFGKYRYGNRQHSFRVIKAGRSVVFNMLSQAAREHRPVRLIYKGVEQIVCPYIVGETTGEERAFVLIDKSWSCLRLLNVEHAELSDEPWIAAAYPRRVQRCVDTVFIDANR